MEKESSGEINKIIYKTALDISREGHAYIDMITRDPSKRGPSYIEEFVVEATRAADEFLKSMGKDYEDKL